MKYLICFECYIPEEILCNKLIGLSIGGFGAPHDNIGSFQDYMQHYAIFNNPLIFAKLLYCRTDEEIKSFWYFIFDYYCDDCCMGTPHEIVCGILHIEKLKNFKKMAKQYPRVYKLMLEVRDLIKSIPRRYVAH